MQRQPKTSFKLETTRDGNKRYVTRVKFYIDEKAQVTVCQLVKELHRRELSDEGKFIWVTEKSYTLAKAKVTCKEGDKYDLAQGKLLAFTAALDKLDAKLTKRFKADHNMMLKIKQRQGDALLTRCQSYIRNGR